MKEYTDIIPVFSLYKEQLEEASNWRAEHMKEKHNSSVPYAGAIGGAFGWKFIDTTLGTVAINFCMCGEEINVTNFDDW